MFNAVLVMGGIGIVVGVGLALASKIFYVYVDPNIVSIDDILPGANCGGCGLPGCAANAEAIVAGKASPDSCVAAGDDVTREIAAVLGVSIEEKEPDIAISGCSYGLDTAETKFLYDGLKDCRAVALLGGGMKVCNIGCLGLGTCALQCPFDAIHLRRDGLPVIDESKCTGCGTCERVCPKNIIKLSSVTRRILNEYTIEDCTTPCQRSCPAGIDISRYIQLVSQGDYAGSIQVIKDRNPFPTVVGRICPRPCETACRRKYIDEPVAINAIKCFVADYERESGKRVLPFKAPATGRKIAIVGGGVHGLSAAFFLARLGHSPTVFEATDRLGGLLNTAIPKYRLPEEILAWDIEGIAEMGVDFEMNKSVGLDVDISELFADGFGSVFLASGGWDSRLARCDTKRIVSPVPGAFLLIDFIGTEFLKSNLSETLSGINVLCVGGEELLEKMVARCKIFGIKNIVVLTKEEGVEKPLMLNNDYGSGIMVEILSGLELTKLKGRGNDLSSVELTDLRSGEVRLLDIDIVLFSGGRFPEVIFVNPIDQVLFEEEDTNVVVDSWTGFLPHKSTLLGAIDSVSDFSSAISAIAAGRRAAANIHNVMYGIPLSLPDGVLKTDSFIQNVYYLERVNEVPRNIMTSVNGSDLIDYPCCEAEKGAFEIEEIVLAEASRCLRCGLICYKHSNDVDIKSENVKN